MSNNLEQQGDGGGEIVLCPVCGVENPADAEICNGCSFTFGEDMDAPGNEEPQTETGSSEVDENGNGIICGGCGAELPMDTTSCFICGEEVNALEEEISDPDTEASTELDAEASAEPDSEADEPSPDSEEPVEDWDLGVVGGDEAPEDSGDVPDDLDDLDLDDEPDEDIDAPDDEPVDAMPELGPNEFHCPSCSKAIPMGTSKCPNCWADIPDMIRCPQCEIAIPMASEACPECFAKLENGVLIEVPEEEPVEAFAEVDEFDEVDEDLMPQEEETEEFFEEVTEVYGVECPFCRAIASASDDICPECGMPLIEEEEQPKLRGEGLKQQQPEHDWYRIIAFSLVLVLLVTAIIPFAIPLPHVDRAQIRIDGSFSDWEPVTSHIDMLSDASNDNIDIIDYKMISDAFNIYFYIQVDENARVFGDSQGDTSRIFIDTDQDSSTGYSIRGIGADYQIRVFGHGGDVESSSCLQFDQSRNQADFNGFESFCPSVPHTAIEEFDKFEVRVALEDLNLDMDQPVTAVYYMADTFGNMDYSDTPLCNVGSLLFVDQESTVDASGIISGPSADVLSLTMTALGEPFDIAGISIDNSTGTYPTSMGAEEVLVVNLTTSATGRSSGSWVHEKAAPEDFNVPDAHVVVVGQGAFAYANSAPSLIEIDGAFADWAGKGMTFEDLDGPTMKNGIDENNDAGLDMLDQTTVVEDNTLNILVNSDGDMLAGMWVPEIEETYTDTLPDTRAETSQPDYTYSEPQVDRTRAPDLQRPTSKPEKTGEGAVKVFIDTDNSPATGYIIGGIGADYLVEALGQDGQVTSTRFSSFSGSDQNLQEWTIESVASDAATSGSSVEISVSMDDLDVLTDVTANATAVIQLVDWNLNGDISDLTAWDIFETGTRRGTRDIDPDAGGLEGAVSLDGVTPIANATVIARNGFNQIAAYVTFAPPPGFDNYFITLSDANYNDPIKLYGRRDDKYNYREVDYPLDNKVQNAVETNFALSEDIPSVSPQNVQLTNLGATEKKIQLDWTHGSDPTNYRIFTTNRTGNYINYENRGRYYHFPEANIAGSSTSYIHTDPVYNQTNYYIIQAVNGTDYNYSQEISIAADYWAPEISHTLTTAQANSAYVNISANITDGFGVSSATVFYRKGSTGPFAELAMSNYLGTPQNGSWRAWIPIDYAGEQTAYYQYYITANDSTYPSVFGAGGSGDPTPMDFNSTSPGNDPYPIYGYVKWGDGSLVGPGVQVYIEWRNTTGPWPSSVIHDASISPGDPNAFPEITNAASQYSIDMMQYDHFSTIWGNATINGIWGYNITLPNEPSPGEFDGGKLFNITLEAPALNITKTAPDSASAGENIIYTIMVNNTGNTTAYDVNVTDTLSPDVTFVSAVPAESGNIGNVYYWNIGDLAPGEYFWINITVQINPATLIGTIVTNNANATCFNSTLGQRLGEVNATADTLIGAADMNITKWATPIANPGELITYWINYTNEGNQWATNVSIIETYPAGVTFVSSIPAPTVGDNYWFIGDVAPLGGDSIEITVQVNLTTTGTLMNTVNVSMPGTIADWAYAFTNITNPDMTVTKVAPATANTGEIIMYQIDYSNIGTDWAYNVWVNDTLPAGVTIVDANPMPTVPPDCWLIGDLAPGESGTIFLNVSIDAGTVGLITNWVYLDYVNNVSAMPQESDWANTTIADPFMFIDKTAPATANTGEQITYWVNYSNIGTDWAYNIWVNDTLPVGVTFVSAIPGETSSVGQVYSWFIGNLAPGASGTIIITVQIDADANGTLTNFVSLDYEDAAGEAQLPVFDTADTTIIDPLVTITKEGPASANTGEIITYWINYTNIGTDTAYNITITETYPANVTFISAIPVPDFSNNVWNISTLAPGASGTIIITVQIDADAVDDQINTVTMDYEDRPGELQAPEFDQVITVINDPLMDIMKIGPGSATPGQDITYIIQYWNNGTDAAYNVVITENYPAGTTFVSAIPMPDIGDNIWIIPVMAPGTSGMIQVTLNIDPGTTGLLTNNVSLDYEDFAAEVQPTEWAEWDTIVTWPMMNIQKTGPANASAGETIMYQIDYWNSGSDDALNVTIIETYPIGVIFVNATPPPTTGNNVWIFPSIAAGANGTIFINVTIDPLATGILVNNVTMDYNNTANQTMPQKWNEVSTFLDGPLMNVTKTGPGTANSGETIMYVIYYENTGDDTAYNVTITENYPAGVDFVDANPPPTTGDNEWFFPSIAAGANGTIFINVTVNASATGTLTNWAYLEYENDAGLLLPIKSDFLDTVIEDPLMTIEKTGPTEANPGEVIQYIITYQNIGTANATNVWINDTLPAGVTFVSSLPVPDFSADPLYGWNFPILAPGESGTIIVDVMVVATIGTVINTAILEYADGAGESQTPVDDDWLINIVNPLINITKDAPGFAAPGQFITYWINYSNIGTDWAYNVTITENYPIGVTFISAIPAPTIPDNFWYIGAIAPGGSGLIEIVVQIGLLASGDLVNTIDVAYNNSAIAQPIEIDTATTTVINCTVTIEKIAPEFANTGEIFTYTLYYNNTGLDWAYNVTITETYPADVTFISAIPAPDIGNNVWNIGNLAPGTGSSINITVQVNAGLPVGTILTNNVLIDFKNAGGIAGIDTNFTITEVIDPVMTIVKTGPVSGIAAPGETIMYQIDYFNTGTDTAYNVVITETYPVGVTFVNSTPVADNPGLGDNIWTFPSIAAGTGGTIFINVTIDTTITGNITNLAELGYENKIGVSMELEVVSLVIYIEGPYVEISKLAPGFASVGETITYTLVYANTGNNTAYNVYVNDTLPGGVTYVGALPVEDGNVGSTYYWFIGTLLPGDSGTIIITVTVNAGATILINTGTVNYTTDIGGTNWQMNMVNATTIVDGPLLTITKTAPATANTGETIYYTITIENTGTAVARFIEITETYPADTTFVNANPFPTLVPNYWDWTTVPELITLVPGDSFSIQVELTVNNDAVGILNNTVTAYYENLVGTPWPTIIAWADTLVIDPLLTIDKTAPEFANTGEQITYTITVENIGTDWAYDVIITETYPVGVTFISAVPVPTSGNNVWVIPALAAGDSVIITITVEVTALSGSLLNTADADYNNSARQMLAIQDTAITEIINPDMTLSKDAPAEAVPGDTITYWINYSNIGTDWAYNVTITETYPPGVTFIGAIPAPTTPNDIWLFPAIAPGANGSIQIKVQVDLLATGWINNTVEMGFENKAGIVQTEVSVISPTQIVQPLMTITKTGPLTGTATQGETITYTITYENTGLGTAYNVIITDTVPVGTTFVSSVPPPTVPNSIWVIGDLAPGASGTITITVEIDNSTVGTITNWAYLNYENVAGIAQPEESDFNLTTIIVPVMTISKEAPAFANTGEAITYWINYTNVGDDWAYNVWVNDTLPAGVTFVSAVPGETSSVGQTYSWFIGNLAPGASGTIAITVNITALSGTLTNWASLVFENSIGKVYPVVQDFAQTEIINPVMEITKWAPASANTGELITYIIWVNNTGTDTAYNVVVTETYPAGVIFVSAIPPPTSGNNVWNLGAVAPGASIPIFITVQINATGLLTNSVDMTFDNRAGLVQIPVNATASTLVGDPMMEIIKVAPITANVNETIMYTIYYWNNGTQPAYNVIITETYPAGVTFVDANPAPDIGDNIWLIGTVPAGGSGVIFINVTVDANATGVLTNNVDLEYEDEAGLLRPIESDFAITIITGPFMTVDKTAPEFANPGETIMYTISYSNIGTGTAYNVTITEGYPAGVTFVDANPMPTTPDNFWDIGTLLPGEGGIIYINVTIAANATGNLTNAVGIVYEDSIGEIFTISDIAVTTIREPILVIVKEGPEFANPGQTITYWINYTNVGSDWAYNVTITETYDAQVTFVSAIPAPTTGDNVWDLGSIGPGATGSIQVTVIIDINATGTIINTVLGEYNDGTGTAKEQAIDTWDINIVNPTITISKSAATALPGFALPGETFTYTITYTNPGPYWAYNVIITEIYPAEVSFVSAIPAPDIGNNIWLIGPLAPGASGSIVITVQVAANASGIVNNTAMADYENFVGTAMPTESAFVDVNVIAPDIQVNKTAPAFANTGEIIIYTINVTNNGVTNIDNVILTETYPAGVTFISSIPAPSAGNNLWLIGTLLPGQTETIVITVQVNLSAFGNLTNNVQVDFTDYIGQSYPAVTDQAITSIIDPVMTVDKTGPAFANPGETITYTITYENIGTDDAHNVTITETYPGDVTFVSAIPAPDIGNNVWNLGTIAAGASGTITITVTVDAAASGIITNYVALDYESNVRAFPQETASWQTTIIEPDMSITKDAPDFANTGQIITYWINYSNTGTDWAYDVIITEAYPADVTFISAVPAPDIGNNVWLIGDMAPGASGMIIINVMVDAGAIVPLTNWVYLDYNSTALVMPQESDLAITDVIDPLLTITKDAPATATQGEQITYTITVENIGTDVAYDVYIYEIYPAGVTFVSSIPAPVIGNNVWNFSTIAPGETRTIVITVDISIFASGDLENWAYVDYEDSVGELQTREWASDSTLVTGPSMSIDKWATPSANATDIITYWINYTNTGTGWAFDVIITETYPADVTFISAIPAPTFGNNIWNVGNLAPGATGSIQITVQVNLGATGVLVNWADLDYDNDIGIPYPTEWDSATTVLGDIPYVQIIKTAPPYANSGDTIQYVISWANVGLVTAYNVWINDTIPAGMTFIVAVPAEDVTSVDPNYYWSLGDLLPGASGTITIDVLVDGSVYGTLTNIAQVEYKNTLSENFIDTVIASTLVRDALMEVVKTAPANASVPDAIMYTISYTNIGNDTAYNVVIEENYPAGTTFLNATPAPTIVPDTWNIGNVASGASFTIYINVSADAPGVWTNWVFLNYTNTSAWAQPTVSDSAITVVDLATGYMLIEKDAPATANQGEIISYYINYTNVGLGTAFNVWINDTIPAGMTFLIAVPAEDVTSVDPNYYWSLGDLAPGASGTIIVDVTVVAASGTIMNQVDVEWTTGTNAAFANTTIVAPVMEVTKTAPSFAQSPDTIQYTIDYQNTGTDTAYNVNITETYPAGITYFLASPLPTFSDDVWIIAAVPAGGTGTITITVTIAGGLILGTVLDNIVTLDYENGAGAAQLQESDNAETVITNVEMEITKMAPAVADPGTQMIYTITYWNNGPATATDVSIEEFYPPGVTYSSDISAPPVPRVGNVWIIGDVLPGLANGGTITITVDIAAAATGVLTNRAQLNYTDTASNMHFMNATAQTVVTGPLMDITKDVDKSMASAGEVLEYTINYENIGPGIANQVIITENYPAGVTFIGASPMPSIGNNVWNLGAINGSGTSAGSSGSITIWVSIDSDAFGSLTNWAYLEYEDLSGVPQATIWDSASTLIAGPSVGVNKEGPSTANPGQIITYWINYTNLGLGPARIVIEDPIPTGLAYVDSYPAGFNAGTYIIWSDYLLGIGSGSNSASIMVNFTVTASSPGVVVNTAYLNYTDTSGNAFDPVQDSNITLIVDPFMVITKEGPTEANSGETFTYWLNYTNTGNDWAYNVEITETYGAGINYMSAVPAPTAGNNYWFIGLLAPGASGSIQVTVEADPANVTGDLLINLVEADYENSVISLPTESVTLITTVLDPELALNKSAPAIANSGELITYVIWINNTGGADAYNLMVTEAYPADVIFISSVPVPDIGDNVWFIGFLAAGDTTQINITVMVEPTLASGTWLFNNVTADYEDGVGEPQLQVLATNSTQVLDPLLTVDKTGPATANTGQQINYTITVTNTGPVDAVDVLITDTYPLNGTIFFDALPMPINPGAGNNTWFFALIPAGGSVTIIITVNITFGGNLTNLVTVEYYNGAFNSMEPITDAVTTRVVDPHMTIEKTANATVVPGGFILYNITYENVGTGNATNVTITDLYPADVVFVWASPAPDIGTDTWIIADLPANTTGWINILVQVDVNTTLNTILTNEATMTYQNQANATFVADPAYYQTRVIGPTMAIQKYGPVNASAGEMFNYTIVYTNTGSDWAYNVIISDIIPFGITVLDAIPIPTSTLLGNYVWNIGTVAPGASATIQLTVMGTVAGTRINNATLNYENAAGIALPEIYSEVSTVILGVLVTGPPEVTTIPPDFIFAGQNFTLYASAIDRETGIDTIILYWVDIYGVQDSQVMVPLLIDANGNGVYQLQLPPQPYKGFISYFVWVNDTDGNTNRTGIYDVPVRLPPYFIWGYIYSAQGDTVDNGIIQVTDIETAETVIARTDGVGFYQVDLATLYSGYLNGEEISVFATDGLYYGTNSTTIDLDFYEDTGLDYYDGTGMEWPNRHVDVVLSEIPEFTAILTPIIGILILVLFLRRNRRRNEDEYEN